jgi:hypothetical protein
MPSILPLTMSAERMARRSIAQGNLPRAYRIVRRLLARPEAAGTVAATWHALAAGICIQLGAYPRALKHFKVAFQHERENPARALRIAKWYDAEGDAANSRRWRKRAGVRAVVRSPRVLPFPGRSPVVALKLYAG